MIVLSTWNEVGADRTKLVDPNQLRCRRAQQDEVQDYSKPQEVFDRHDIIWKVVSVVSFVSLSPRRKQRVLIPNRHVKANWHDGVEVEPITLESARLDLLFSVIPPRYLPGNFARSLLHPRLWTEALHLPTQAYVREYQPIISERCVGFKVPQCPTQGSEPHAINLRAQPATKYQL